MAPARLAPRLLTVLVTASLAFGARAQQELQLPDLGSSANALLTPQEARSYGASMLHEMRAMDMVVDDALVDDYINDLGYRLVAGSDKPKEHFAFFVVKDNQINAFAAPGGYIAVNSGLITLTRDQSELAGVIAHEIGHITQSHLQRAFEESKKNAPLMALVLLGAVAAGAGGHSGDSSMAVLAAGQGMIAQKSINFTRKDEIEADRVGIETLAHAGFDPHAMAGFFQRMQDTLRTGAGEKDVPELLQTHPVTLSRISDAKSRADALAAQQKLRPHATAQDLAQWEKSTAPIPFVKNPAALLPTDTDAADNARYAQIRERVRVLSGDAVKLALYYGANLHAHPAFDTPSNRYGYALALTRSGRGEEAIGQLEPLLTRQPDDPIVQLALADARWQAGQRAQALALYARLHEQSPRDRAVALAYGKALIATDDPAQSRRAASLLRPLLNEADEPEIYRTYARASEKAGDSVRAGEAYADASYLSGRPFDALEQLKRLLARDDLDYYARARIQARIAELTPLVLELRKRKVNTEDNPDGRSQPVPGSGLRPAGEACAGRLCLGIDAR